MGRVRSFWVVVNHPWSEVGDTPEVEDALLDMIWQTTPAGLAEYVFGFGYRDWVHAQPSFHTSAPAAKKDALSRLSGRGPSAGKKFFVTVDPQTEFATAGDITFGGGPVPIGSYILGATVSRWVSSRPALYTSESEATRDALSRLPRRSTRTAGEIRHVKDVGEEASMWAYSGQPPGGREITKDFHYSPKMAKDLARCLRSTTAAMGHAISAQNRFARLKSRNVSPDGRLGGKGYIANVKDIRKQYFNVVEALSSITDTLYDEVNAPHWSASSRGGDEEVKNIVKHTEEIREDPEGWADSEIDQDQEERT